ncbi:MAG: ATP-binding protein [Cryobacterium sp.]
MAAARPAPAARLGSGTDGSGTLDHSGRDLIGKARQPRKPISRAQIETVISRSVAGVGVVFALQALPLMIDQTELRRPILEVIAPSVLAVALLSVLITAIIKRGIRVATGSVALVYGLALIGWPFLMLDGTTVLDGVPWLWFLCTVATSCAAIAFRVGWAVVYTVLTPIVYGIIRLTPSGGAADLLLASLDAVYAMLLGLVVLIIIVMLRQAAAAVDGAQLNALDRYERAVRQHATEVERVEVDSIVHDTVLATLLSAAGARSSKASALAAAMARNALARLEEAGSASAGDETVIPFSSLSRRIREAAAAIASPFVVSEQDLAPQSVPVHASEAIYSATVQAMVNSLEHAGPAGGSVARTLTMKPNLQGGCTIEIADTGVGFDPDTVPSERLGLRVSIQDRVTSAGGSVEVHTALGHGTRIVIDWPRPAGEPDPLVGLFSTDEFPVLGLPEAALPEGGAQP